MVDVFASPDLSSLLSDYLQGGGGSVYRHEGENLRVIINPPFAPKKGLEACVGQALMSNAGSLLLDGAGIALTFSPLAPEAKVLGAIALGSASAAVGALEANTTSTKGTLATAGAIANIFGIQTAPLELAQEFAQFSRGAGKTLTAVGVGADLASVYLDSKQCLGNQ